MPLPNDRPLISFDWAIKRLLRQKANFGILEGFLSELLREDVVVKSILESEANKDNAESKLNKFDLLCENDKGELLAIELQFYPEVDFLHRMLFGTSKLVSDFIKQGDTYEVVKKVYSINIVYFDLGLGSDYVYHGKTVFYGLHHQDELKLSIAQQKKLQKEHVHQIFPEYYIIKVNNFDNIAMDTFDEWIYYLKTNKLPEMNKAKGLKDVEAQLKIDNMETQEKIEYEGYMKGLVVSKSMIETAKLEGEIQESTKKNREFTINLITNTDFDDAKIATLVGVDAAWVAEIRKGLGV
jgi:predicted transposase/invertase (TIGR01784 family)